MSSEPLLAPARLLRSSGSSASLSSAPGPTAALDRYAPAIWLTVPLLLGALLGSALPSQCGLPPPVDRISAVIGWIYFSAWSVSFYPQVWINHGRKSVVGLSLDFQLLNMLGFTCYAIYNSALYWSPAVRAEYARHHDGDTPAVHRNDVFFSLHAAAITAVTLVQCFVHDRGEQRVSRAAMVGVAGTAAAGAAYAAAVLLAPGLAPPCPGGLLGLGGCDPKGLLTWLSWLYFLSFVKLAISLVKYIPQVMLNWRRRSTEGWNIWNVVLDLEGGVLSLAQQLLDSGVTKDWSAVTGNPVKFGLGFTSIFFDVIFLLQHYVLFPQPPLGLPVWDGGDAEQGDAGAADAPAGKAGLAAFLPEAEGSEGIERRVPLLGHAPRGEHHERPG